jgi:hypothetical protein
MASIVYERCRPSSRNHSAEVLALTTTLTQPRLNCPYCNKKIHLKTPPPQATKFRCPECHCPLIFATNDPNASLNSYDLAPRSVFTPAPKPTRSWATPSPPRVTNPNTSGSLLRTRLSLLLTGLGGSVCGGFLDVRGLFHRTMLFTRRHWGQLIHRTGSNSSES